MFFFGVFEIGWCYDGFCIGASPSVLLCNAIRKLVEKDKRTEKIEILDCTTDWEWNCCCKISHFFLSLLSSIGCNVLLFLTYDRVLIWCNCFNRKIEDSSC